MKNLKFNVRGQNIIPAFTEKIIADSKNYFIMSFEFSEEWNDFIKTAVITVNDTVYNCVINNNGIITSENLPRFEKGALKIAVFGGDFLVTDEIILNVHPSGYKEGIAPPYTPPDLYTQLTEDIYTKEENITEIESTILSTALQIENDKNQIESYYSVIEQQAANINQAKNQVDNVLNIVESISEEVETNKNIVVTAKEEVTADKNYINGKVSEVTETAASGITQMNEILTQAQTMVGDIPDELSDIKAYIGYSDTDIAGLEADFANNIFTRLSGAVGKTAGTDFDSFNMFGGRKRCIVDDTGNIIAYYGDPNYNETPVYGQVMVYQPKFYYRVVPLALEPNGKSYHLIKARYYLSDTPKSGFKIHPAFVSNGVEKEYILLSAYEGSIYDTSASIFLKADEQTANFEEDKLCSVAMLDHSGKPCSGKTQSLTRGNARKLAQNRGTGWNISTIQSISATQLLFAVEYGGFNTQELLGKGSISSIQSIGQTSSFGNSSGVVTGNNMPVTYRGEENFYGNMFKFIDGINIKLTDGKPEIYIADNNFEESKITEQYKHVNIDAAKTNGFVSAFGYTEEYDWLFLASETSGTSALPVGDEWIMDAGDTFKTMIHGGYPGAPNGTGGYNFRIKYPAYKAAEGSCRLIFIP